MNAARLATARTAQGLAAWRLAGDPVGIDRRRIDGAPAEADILVEEFKRALAAVDAEL